MLVIPIHAFADQKDVIGAMMVESWENHPFTSTDMAAFRTYAANCRHAVLYDRHWATDEYALMIRPTGAGTYGSSSAGPLMRDTL